MQVNLNITESYWPAHKAAVERVLDVGCAYWAFRPHREGSEELRLAINAVCRAYGLPDRVAVQEGKG